MQDAKMPLPRLQSMYTEMVLLIRKLYQECRLVHGDLSEYNILVNDVRLSYPYSRIPVKILSRSDHLVSKIWHEYEYPPEICWSKGGQGRGGGAEGEGGGVSPSYGK